MAQKTPIDKLADAISGILNEYEDDVQDNLALITQKFGQKGAKALKQASRETFPNGTGEYANGWKHEFRKTRRYAKTTVFNEHYSLPHLLEHGHATRNGTDRVYPPTPGREHIKPVADKLAETFEREVVDKL